MKSLTRINRFTPLAYFVIALSLTTLTLLTFSGTAKAENDAGGVKTLYKKVDKNGRITFTDKPLPGAKEVTVDTQKNLLSMPRKASEQYHYEDDEDAKKKEKPFKYNYLAIETPKTGESIRANDGSLYVLIGITPQLKGAHTLRLLMDGAAISEDQKAPYFSLSNIDRGTHNLQVQIIEDSSQKVIQSSPISTFHLHRASLLQSNRR